MLNVMKSDKWVRPEGAVINMQLKKERLKTQESTELTFKLHNLTDAELLAWLTDLHYRNTRRLQSLSDKYYEVINEGTVDECTVLNEVKFKEERLRISAEAKKLLLDNFNYRVDDADDLYEFFNISWEH